MRRIAPQLPTLPDIRESPHSPRIAPTPRRRGAEPNLELMPDWRLNAPAEPGLESDQRISW
jgi:hypothetical protein